MHGEETELDLVRAKLANRGHIVRLGRRRRTILDLCPVHQDLGVEELGRADVAHSFGQKVQEVLELAEFLFRRPLLSWGFGGRISSDLGRASDRLDHGLLLATF